MVKDLLGNVDYGFHVPEVASLLVEVTDAARPHVVIRRTELSVNVVTGQEHELQPLVIVIVLDAPDGELVVELLPIWAEETARLTLLHRFESFDCLRLGRGKLLKILLGALVERK